MSKIFFSEHLNQSNFSFKDKFKDPFISNIDIFYKELIKENENQNLTRLTSLDDFYNGHLLDVLHLEECKFLNTDSGKIPFDLGSGGGIPGLLHSFLFNQNWVLCDSEKQKAAFLTRFCDEYSLKDNLIVNSRAENWLSNQVNAKKSQQIVTRAVGTVTKIYTWLEKCSTWNELILFKGPNWENEWSEFKLTRFRNKLKIANEYSYTVGDDQKTRKIIHLTKN